MYNKKQREMYNLDRDITCEKLGITVNQYNQFRRLGSVLHTIYELSCNGDLSEEQYEADTNNVYAKADKLAKDLGLKIFYQTDPRGATIYLSRDPISENSYNTSAQCVY